MEKTPTYYGMLCCILCCCLSVCTIQLQAQVNADFSSGTFAGWTGTYSINQCSAQNQNGHCTCSNPNPFNADGLNQGPDNNAPDDAVNEYSQIITTVAGGNDPNLVNLGYNMPMVFPGNAYSARIGNMWQKVSSTKTGDAESISYSFNVNASNCNFIYHYAVVLYSGNHTADEQAYFNISMIAGASDTVACAAYQVDATTAENIGGFISNSDSIYWKPWSSVVVPLYNYIGQNVTITFITKGCIPKGCAGKHYAYAYIAAECAPFKLGANNDINCGEDDTLTAPAGSATYTWSGPGIVGSNSNQQVIINRPGRYVVTMTTHGDVPCSFTLDTVIGGTYLVPAFTVPTTCVGDSVKFSDHSTTTSAIASWQWDFGDGGTSNIQNPTHTFTAAGTYPVKLTITNPPCIKDTTIQVTVVEPPTATFTAESPVCIYTKSTIVYTGNAPASYTYNWNFDGGGGIPVTGPGPLRINWTTSGTKTIILQVTSGSCYSVPDTVQVLVKPFLGMQLSPYTTVCQGRSVTLTATNCDVYQWAPAGTLNDDNTASVIATPLTTTNYSVTGSTVNCLSVDTVTVGVYNYPTTSFTATGPECIGQNSTITYTGDGGTASTYNWDFHAGNATGDTGAGPFMANWLTPGNHYITLNISRNGCDTTATDTVSVYSQPPHPVLTADTLIGCRNLLVCFTSAPVGNNIGYIWNFGDGDTANAQNTCHVYPATGSYSVSFQVALSPECIFDTTMLNLVTIVPDAVASFTPDAAIIQQPQSQIDFTNQSQNALRYLWNFATAGNGNVILGSSTTINPSFSFTDYGGYSVTLYAYNALGCPDSITHHVTVLPSQNYFIPNAFTPNGDGVNDDFYVIIQEGATLMSFQIFDRLGEKVHDGLYPWDGNYKGKKAPEGVYVYRANLHLIDMSEDVERKGSVTLMR